MLERVTVTRYVTPLREGQSAGPGRGRNLGTYVLKFRGAGHGTLALVAEVIGGELARRLGLRTSSRARYTAACLTTPPPNWTGCSPP